MRGIVADTASEIVAEDPTRIRNRANYSRLEKISADLLQRAIAIMKDATQEDCERLQLRCYDWHEEKDAVVAYLHANVDPDNWELVRFDEPRILEKGPQYNPFVPAQADSPNDSWPGEKWDLWRFVNANISEANRHLVKLLNPEDIKHAKEARKPKVVT